MASKPPCLTEAKEEGGGLHQDVDDQSTPTLTSLPKDPRSRAKYNVFSRLFLW